MDEATVADYHAELIMRDAVLFSREARLHAALQSSLNAIYVTQNELQLLLALSDQQCRYLNSNVEHMGAHLEGLGAHRLQLCTDYDHTRAQRADIAEFIHGLLSF
ncbi:hypothetical protein HAV15_010186 [Penicillium sp. str. |nr:hypothetical protein HAV15_010186 [Penicillium sp. str. \